MDEQHNANAEKPVISAPKSTVRNSVIKTLMLTLVILVVAVAGMYGVYGWQHHKVVSDSQKITNLNSELSRQKNLTAPVKSGTTSTATTFTYTPKTAGLSITLPKTYSVLVAADGNAGGAPGVLFKVVPSGTGNIASDWSYDVEARVVASPTFTTLDQAASAAEQELMDYVDCNPQNGRCDISDLSVSDTTVANLPAKLIKANGINEYLSNYNVYVVGLGQWDYQITVDNIPNNTDISSLLSTALKGIAIKQAAY